MLPRVPAGTYRVDLAGARTGRFDVRAGRSFAPIYSVDISESSPGRREMTFPVDVGPLVMTTPRDVRANPHAQIWLRPLRLFRESATSVQSARYGPAAVFSLDHRTFLEPPGFWIQGDSAARIAVVLDDGVGASLLLRSGARPVSVAVQMIDAPAERIELAAGEVRTFPFAARQGPAFVSFDVKGGFRPRDVDPGSQDARWLGCWVEFVRGS
jgi:hypothetical protein